MHIDSDNIDGLSSNIRKQIKSQLDDTPKKSNGRNDFEHELQVQVMKYLNLQYPELDRQIFAIPNGGARDAVTGKKLKDEGVLAGVWDLFVGVPSGDYHGCFIETKWGKNGLSKSQKKFRKANNKHYYFFVYRTLDEFIEKLNEYLNQ